MRATRLVPLAAHRAAEPPVGLPEREARWQPRVRVLLLAPCHCWAVLRLGAVPRACVRGGNVRGSSPSRAAHSEPQRLRGGAPAAGRRRQARSRHPQAPGFHRLAQPTRPEARQRGGRSVEVRLAAARAAMVPREASRGAMWEASCRTTQYPRRSRGRWRQAASAVAAALKAAPRRALCLVALPSGCCLCRPRFQARGQARRPPLKVVAEGRSVARSHRARVPFGQFGPSAVAGHSHRARPAGQTPRARPHAPSLPPNRHTCPTLQAPRSWPSRHRRHRRESQARRHAASRVWRGRRSGGPVRRGRGRANVRGMRKGWRGGGQGPMRSATTTVDGLHACCQPRGWCDGSGPRRVRARPPRRPRHV